MPASPQATNSQTEPTVAQPTPTLKFQKTGSLLKPKTSPQATVATQAPPLSSPGPITSGRIFAPAVGKHRQQQCKALLAQAQQLLLNQNYGTAFETVEKVLQMQPDDTSALILKGQLLGTAGRSQEALAVIEQILQIDPNNTAVWNMRAVALSNMGQYQQALTAIERSLALNPQSETYTIKATIMTNLAGKQGKRAHPLILSAKFNRYAKIHVHFLLGSGCICLARSAVSQGWGCLFLVICQVL